MTDWATISSLATAGGTLILAVATFQSVRSANRSARLAEWSLMEGVRPVLIPSRGDDPDQEVRFGDSVVLTVPGHGGSVHVQDDVLYLAMAIRNAGSGVAVLHGWRARPAAPQTIDSPMRREMIGDPMPDRETAPINARPDLAEFRRQQLDLYIPAGETGFWQGALRDPQEPGYAGVRAALEANEALWIDVLFGDYEGGQRTILRTRMNERDDDGGARVLTLRYWNLDRDDPR